MRNTAPKDAAELEALEIREWLESLDYVLQSGGPTRVSRLLRELADHAQRKGVKQPFTANTPYDGDIIFFQGHASPGIYARAFVEGRIPAEKLENFRRELKPGGGLSSYHHPWMMPDFWEFPTVSMGLGPIMEI